MCQISRPWEMTVKNAIPSEGFWLNLKSNVVLFCLFLVLFFLSIHVSRNVINMFLEIYRNEIAEMQERHSAKEIAALLIEIYGNFKSLSIIHV